MGHLRSRRRVPTSDLRDAVLFLAPGFIALRIFHAFGFRRPRTDWHWAVWSIIASVPLDYAARWVLVSGPRFVDLPSDVADAATRLLLAIAAGVALSASWFGLRRSKWWVSRRLVRDLTDSIWDLILEDSYRSGRPLEVETTDGARYFGWYEVAREDTGAEPWIYLTRVTRQDPDGTDDGVVGRLGVLIHRSQVRSIAIFENPKEAATRRATADVRPGTTADT